MIRDSFPGINSPGQALVEHARSFSGSRTRLQWSMNQASVEYASGFSGVGGGGVLEPPTLSEDSGKLSSSPQNSGSHLQGILGKSGILNRGLGGPQERCCEGLRRTAEGQRRVPGPGYHVSCSRADECRAVGVHSYLLRFQSCLLIPQAQENDFNI
jgi:hypothetical protein